MMMAILFCICPVIAALISSFYLLFSKKKKMIYFFIFAFLLAIIAYYYIPDVTEDLYRHHSDVYTIRLLSKETVMNHLLNGTEQISYLIKYFISLTGNVNLLQFFVTLIDYMIIFYMTKKIIDKYKMTKFSSRLIFLFTICSFSYLTIISNLWNTFALVIFSFGLYLEYEEKKPKWLCYFLYFATLFIHSSMVVPFVLILIFKFMGEKISFKIILIIILGILCLEPILNFLTSNFSASIFIELKSFYNNYFINEDNFSYLHTTSVLVVYLSKLVPYMIAYFFHKKNHSKITDFALVVTISIFVLFVRSTFSIRFVPIVQLAGLPLLCEIFSKKNPQLRFMFGLLLVVMTLGLGYYQYIQLMNKSWVHLENLFTKNIIEIFEC